MGKAIIIENTDFSGSILGKVTFIEDTKKQARRIVSAFQAKTGTSVLTTELVKMVKALIDNGIYDGLNGIYPLLGSTSEQLCTDLMGKHDVVIDTQVLMPSLNLLERTSLATTTDNNVQSQYDFEKSRVSLNAPISSVGATAFVRMNMKHTSGSVTLGIIDSNLATPNPARIGSYGTDVAAYLYGGSRQYAGAFPDNFATLGMHLKAENTFDVYINSVKEEKTGNSVYDVYQLNYSLGSYATANGANYDTNSSSASGDIAFYLFGYVDDSKMDVLKSIVDEFLAAKGI